MNVRTVGVEEEFLLVDPEGRPRAKGERVVAEADRAEHELQQEQAETASRPHRHLDELLRDLHARRCELAAAAAGAGTSIAALATSPIPVEPTPTPEPRYLRMMREYGLTAQEQLTCGCHVHVSVASKAEGVVALNGIRAWLPVLLALTVNSPFWQGEDTGYSSYRRLVWERWPGSGPTQPFDGPDGYDAAVADMLRSGVLLDEGMVYFDARLSRTYPTLEIRVADVCAEPEDAVLVAALARGLVETAVTDPAGCERGAAVRVELLRGAAWRAARSGVSDDLVDVEAGGPIPAWTLVQRLVDRITPALRRAGDLDAVEEGLERLRRRGTGADLQRASYARRGSIHDVVADAVARTCDLAAAVSPNPHV